MATHSLGPWGMALLCCCNLPVDKVTVSPCLKSPLRCTATCAMCRWITSSIPNAMHFGCPSSCDWDNHACINCGISVETVHCEGMKGVVLDGQGCFAKQHLQCSILGGQQTLLNIQSRSTKRSRHTRRDLVTMAIAAEPLVAETNTSTQRPDRDGRFGRFGGKYVRLTLQIAFEVS